MLKLIVGTKGSGKTKTMIDMIDKAVKTTSGNIVVIEKCMKLTTEINHSARLVDVDEYGVAGADMLYGFVAGVLAGNYDITVLPAPIFCGKSKKISTFCVLQVDKTLSLVYTI